MSFIPNPIHLPMTIAIALLKYPPYKFIFYSFLVSLTEFYLAFSGYYGIGYFKSMDCKFKTEGFMTSPIFDCCHGNSGNHFSDLHLANYHLDAEIRDKNRKYRAACDYAQKNGKPLLVIGGPWGVKSYRRLLNKPAHGNGDVCLDIDRRALEGHPCAVIASCTDIPFS